MWFKINVDHVTCLARISMGRWEGISLYVAFAILFQCQVLVGSVKEC